MGLMLDGEYFVDDPGPDSTAGGRFEKAKSSLRDAIPSGIGASDLHLFAPWNCP